MNYKSNEFALLSLGRCGTTMFQNMINSHSKLYLSDECHWIHGMMSSGLQYHRFAEVDDLTVNNIPNDSKWWNAVRALNSSLIMDKQDKSCGLQYIGKNNLNNISTLYKTYPQLPTIILIRDPRCLLRSLYRTGIGYPSAASDLKNIIQTVRVYSPKVLIIRYEDFVSEAENCINKICTFLNVNFEIEMLHSLANVVSHGTKSALSLSKDTDFKQSTILPPSLLFPICNLVDDIQTLGYETFQESIKILTNEIPTIHSMYSKDLLIHFESTKCVDGVFITEAETNCIGLITINSQISNIELLVKGRKFTPNIFFEQNIFDVRGTKFHNVEKFEHKNFKDIVSLLEIFDTIKQQRIFIYSAGTETKEFVERYTFLSKLNIVAIVDMSPRNRIFTHNGFTKKLIALPQIDNLETDLFLITTLKHCKSAKSNLMELGIDAERIFTVI